LAVVVHKRNELFHSALKIGVGSEIAQSLGSDDFSHVSVRRSLVAYLDGELNQTTNVEFIFNLLE
jgi:hypothetical protein